MTRQNANDARGTPPGQHRRPGAFIVPWAASHRPRRLAFHPGRATVDKLEMEEAITGARGLVDVATAGRFRPQTVPTPEEPPLTVTPFPPTALIERTDQ
jgi:hypothetical protein